MEGLILPRKILIAIGLCSTHNERRIFYVVFFRIIFGLMTIFIPIVSIVIPYTSSLIFDEMQFYKFIATVMLCSGTNIGPAIICVLLFNRTNTAVILNNVNVMKRKYTGE